MREPPTPPHPRCRRPGGPAQDAPEGREERPIDGPAERCVGERGPPEEALAQAEPRLDRRDREAEEDPGVHGEREEADPPGRDHKPEAHDRAVVTITGEGCHNVRSPTLAPASP